MVEYSLGVFAGFGQVFNGRRVQIGKAYLNKDCGVRALHRVRFGSVTPPIGRSIIETQIVQVLLELLRVVLLEVPMLLSGLIDHLQLATFYDSNRAHCPASMVHHAKRRDRKTMSLGLASLWGQKPFAGVNHANFIAILFYQHIF